MAESGMSFREVKENVCHVAEWKEILINTGGTSGYLRDTKTADLAGGYGYQDSGRVGSPVRNRFIYWRTSHDILELVETSLDFNLTRNCVRFHFEGAPVLGGAYVHECHGSVVVLVSTVCSVHRLVFPHPYKLQKYDHTYLQGVERSIPSIFTDVSITRIQDPATSHCYTAASPSACHVRTAAAWLTNDGEALFAIATDAGPIILVKMPPYGVQGVVIQHELQQSSVMHRLWSGIVPTSIRGGGDRSYATLSLCIHPMGQDYYVFTVCKDHKMRMWSCKTYECVMATDLLEYMPDNVDPQKLSLGGEGHIVKKSVGSSSQRLHIGVFACFSDRCQFCVFQPIFAEERFQLNHITTVFCPQDELVDFVLSSQHIWSLWSDSQGDVSAKCADISGNRGQLHCWRHVTMETMDAEDLEIPENCDPKTTYLDQIFYPGRFSLQAVLQALQIFRKSPESSKMSPEDLSMQAVRRQVASAVEDQAMAAAPDCSNLEEEELTQLSLQQWARFYSCCAQYHERGTKPIGVFADDHTGMVSIVRKSCLSYIRPSENSEHLYLTPSEACRREDFDKGPAVIEDEQLLRDVIRLCGCMKTVREGLTDDMVAGFEQDLFVTQSPADIARGLVTSLLQEPGSSSSSGRLRELTMQLQQVEDLAGATNSLVELLDLMSAEVDVIAEDAALEASQQLSVSHLFASRGGVSVVCRGVQQLAQARLDMSRDLLIALIVATEMSDQILIPLAALNQIKSQLIDRVGILVRAYFVLMWAATIVAIPPATAQVESIIRQLEALDLVDSYAMGAAGKIGENSSNLLELFLEAQGGQKVREMMSHDPLFDDDPCALWQRALRPVVMVTAQLLWPYNNTVVFAEFLTCHCQHQALLEYVRLTRDWCETNAATNRFFQGLAFLNCDDPQSASECFLEATQGVATEEFLGRLISEDVDDPQHAQVVFFLKVLGVFEQLEYSELVVSLAQTAISIAEPDDPNVPTLWSKVFKQQLSLGNNQEAYSAMLSNPDASRRKDCLRQFLIVLCERSQLQTLVELPYRDRHVVLEEEVVSILESRARSIDITKHSYYDLLYAFHIFRNNYRKAGSIMYEYGMRLGQEVAGLKGLQKQAKCYLAALNALRLVNPNYAWIVKPVPATGGTSQGNKGRDARATKKQQIEVLDLDVIEKEYILVQARLQLLQKNPDNVHLSGPTPSGDETVGLLVNAGMYDNAVKVCRLLNLSLTPVFEGLASRCVGLADNSFYHMTGDNEYTSEAWTWLQHNQLPPASAAKDSSSAAPSWRLLQNYLERFKDTGTVYHRCVAMRLLSQGFMLPDWFTASYKKQNGAELLRLYLDYNMLEDAADLAMENIDAVMGKGKEFFGLKTSLHCGAPAVWLPYTALEQLLEALEENNIEPAYSTLSQKLEDYLREVDSVSQDHVMAEIKKSKILERRERESGVM